MKRADLQGKSRFEDTWARAGGWLLELLGLTIFTLFAAFLFSRL